MKILIAHASAGAGHTKAAEALYERLKESLADDVRLIDALDFTSPFNKKIYRLSYSLLVTKCPVVWGLFFKLADLPSLQGCVRTLRRFFNGLTAAKLSRYLEHEQFDWILSTHFLPHEVANALKVKGVIKSKVLCVVTDFDVHRIWLQPTVDRYAVACDYSKEKVIKLGEDHSRVAVTGIPVQRKFSVYQDRDEIKARLGLKPDVLTVLMATGSFGMGPIARMVADLAEFQLLVVCGHNKSLYATLTKRALEGVKVFGLVDNMQELMTVADVMITKPGGLSIAEALTKNLPMIFFSAIPGQETNNVNVLQRYGVGISGQSPEQIAVELKRLQFSEDERRAAQKNIAFLAKPQAAEAILSLLK